MPCENLRSCSFSVGLNCSRLNCSSSQLSSSSNVGLGPAPGSPLSLSCSSQVLGLGPIPGPSLSLFLSSSRSESFVEHSSSVSSVVSRHKNEGISDIVGAMEKFENLDVLDFVDLVRLELDFDFMDPNKCKGKPLSDDFFFAIGGRTQTSVSITSFSSTMPISCTDAWCCKKTWSRSCCWGCCKWTLLGVLYRIGGERRRGNLLLE